MLSQTRSSVQLFSKIAFCFSFMTSAQKSNLNPIRLSHLCIMQPYPSIYQRLGHLVSFRCITAYCAMRVTLHLTATGTPPLTRFFGT